jgi:hypothetical protein
MTIALGFAAPYPAGSPQAYYGVNALGCIQVGTSRMNNWNPNAWGLGQFTPAAGAGTMIVELEPLQGPVLGANGSGITTSANGPADNTNGNGYSGTLTITAGSGSGFVFQYNSGAASSSTFAYNSSAATIQTALNSTAGVSGATVTASLTANTFLLTIPSNNPALLTTTVAGTITAGAMMSLADVAAGVWDLMWTHVANNIAAAAITNGNSQVIVQIGNESYASWYPWGGSTCCAHYVAAFEHLSYLFRTTLGYSSWLIDWQAGNYGGYNSLTYSGAQVGDAYFDILSYDYYDTMATADGGPGGGGAADWTYAAGQYFAPGIAYAKLHGKLYGITEWGLGYAGIDGWGVGDDPAWIEAAYYWMRANAPMLAYASYFEATNAEAGSLQRLDGNPQSAAVFQQLFGAWAQQLAGATTHRFVTSGVNRLRIL